LQSHIAGIADRTRQDLHNHQGPIEFLEVCSLLLQIYHSGLLPLYAMFTLLKTLEHVSISFTSLTLLLACTLLAPHSCWSPTSAERMSGCSVLCNPVQTIDPVQNPVQTLESCPESCPDPRSCQDLPT